MSYYKVNPLVVTTCQEIEHCQSLQKPPLEPYSVVIPSLSLIVTLLL